MFKNYTFQTPERWVLVEFCQWEVSVGDQVAGRGQKLVEVAPVEHKVCLLTTGSNHSPAASMVSTGLWAQVDTTASSLLPIYL